MELHFPRAGHAYYFLEDVYPRMSGRRPLKTPSLITAMFPRPDTHQQDIILQDALVNRGAAAAPAAAPAAAAAAAAPGAVIRAPDGAAARPTAAMQQTAEAQMQQHTQQQPPMQQRQPLPEQQQASFGIEINSKFHTSFQRCLLKCRSLLTNKTKCIVKDWRWKIMWGTCDL